MPADRNRFASYCSLRINSYHIQSSNILQFEKFSEGDRDGLFANDVDAICLAPLAKFDSVCDTVRGEDEFAEEED